MKSGSELFLLSEKATPSLWDKIYQSDGMNFFEKCKIYNIKIYCFDTLKYVWRNIISVAIVNRNLNSNQYWVDKNFA